MKTWKTIENFSDYLVSNDGEIKTLAKTITRNDGMIINFKEKIIKPSLDGNGHYLQTHLTKDKKCYTMLVHRVVAEAFISNPQNLPEVNHLDGDKTNNNDWNLEWSTRKNNIEHAMRTKLYKIGENNANAKLTNNEVIKIKELQGQYTCEEIGNMFGVCKQHVSAIHNSKKRIKDEVKIGTNI